MIPEVNSNTQEAIKITKNFGKPKILSESFFLLASYEDIKGYKANIITLNC